MDLIILLQALRPAHTLMAWIMKHSGLETGSSTFVDKEKVLLQLITPATSPVYKALATGCVMLIDRSLWCAALAFNRGPDSLLFKSIWKALLPTLAVIYVRVFLLIMAWPFPLVRLLGLDAGNIAQEFARAPTCCIPPGWRAFKEAASRSLAGEVEPDLLAVIREFVWQLDLANYDKDLSSLPTHVFQTRAKRGSTVGLGRVAGKGRATEEEKEERKGGREGPKEEEDERGNRRG